MNEIEMHCTCFEGRCFWCALLVVRGWVFFAYLEEIAPMQMPDPGEGTRPSFWSGA